MKVLIYEDNKDDVDVLIVFLRKFCKAKNVKIDVMICKTKNAIYNNIYDADLIFLDIEGIDANGIDIGVKIREQNPDVKIIFVSNYSKYLIDGYRALASRYFLKPLDWEFFQIELENVISDYLLNNAGFTDLSISSSKIYYKDILYVEFKDRKTNLNFLSGKVIETSYSLKYWIELLQHFNFAQPYKAYFVNLRHVSLITNQEVVLSNNEMIPLSRLYKKDFETRYIESLKRRI